MPYVLVNYFTPNIHCLPTEMMINRRIDQLTLKTIFVKENIERNQQIFNLQRLRKVSSTDLFYNLIYFSDEVWRYDT